MGVAADIDVDNVSLVDVFKAAEQVPEFKGIGINLQSKFVHVDTRKEVERQLWVYENGKRVPMTVELRKKYIGDV